MDPPAPPDEVTDASLGSVANTVDHDENTEPILRKILEELAGDDSTKGEAESLDDWIARNEGTRQGLEMKDFYGRTPLHVAAARGLSAAATKLIRAGATLNAQDQEGETPLYKACAAESKDIVELLLENGADTTLTTNGENETPLHAAVRSEHDTIVQSLLNKSKQTLDSPSGSYGWTPLHYAIVNGKVANVRYLHDNGAKLDIQDSDGWTPLMTAIVFEREDALKVLLEGRKGEDRLLEMEDSERRTPLLRAAQDHFWEGARLLVMAGAKCDKSQGPKDSQSTDTDSTSVVTPRQNSALHLAVSAKQLEMIQLLLDKGANVNALNERGQHSSHLASSKGYGEILKLLLDFKGSSGLNARDDDGMTPLHLACNADDDDDEQKPPNMTADGQTANGTRELKPGQYLQVVEILLKRSADTRAVTKYNKTALEIAFDRGFRRRCEEIVNSLLEPSDEFSHAILRAASKTERHEVAILLLKKHLKKPDTPLPDESDSWSAVEWAAYTVNPDALWLLIASSPPGPVIKKAIKHAKTRIRQAEDQPAKPTSKSGNQKHGDADGMKQLDNRKKLDNKKPDKSANKLKLIRDYLDDPPIGLICVDSQEYSTPRFDEQCSSVLNSFKAVIVQFENSVGRFGIFKRHRAVEETIYTKGPKALMDDVGILERLAAAEVGQGSPAPTSTGAKSQFTWIHLPATNMTWMDDLLQRIMKDEDKSASEFNQAKSFFKDSWIQVPDKISLSRIMRPRFVWRDTNESVTKHEISNRLGLAVEDPTISKNQDGSAAPSLAAIYIPYFSYSFQLSDEDQSKAKVDTRELEFTNKLIEQRRASEEFLKAYNGKIVHGSSTLDESYYHFGVDHESQNDKRRRNESQVVTYSWRNGQDLGSYWPLIRVNQLWIWTIDDKWLISASSHPIDDSENELLYGIIESLKKQGEAGGSDLQPSSASEMSQFIVDYCVESYERKPGGSKDERKPGGSKGERPENCKPENLLSIRQAFSKSINSIARGETDLFGTFSKLTKELRTVSSLKDQSKDADERSLDEQLADATDKAEDLAKTVKDIIDELNILESTAHYQQDVQRSMKAMKAMKKQELRSTIKEMKKDKIPETDLTATYVINDIQRLDTVAKRVHDAVNTTLSLQQSEVANLQARLSLEQADASARQGRVVMVFTVVTIVFLPLSFLTSFFALDVSSFQPQAWAIGIIFSVSIAFSIPTVILAFTWKQSKNFMSKQLNWILNKKPTGNGGPKPDPGGSRASSLGVNQSRTYLTSPHQTGNREQSISKATELDLEKGHGINGGST